MSFNPQRLLNSLLKFSIPSGYLIGFSGGMDSHVLLNAMAMLGERLPAPLRAIHLDHGLQAESDTWIRHCESVCRKLGTPLKTFSLQLKPVKGESLEAVARHARYGLLARELRSGEMLLTAHHQDDQVETLLLQLLRGAGLSGLAAMPEIAHFASGYHARPLLDHSRAALQHYAEEAQLHWIEDQSNRDSGFDRNYLRHQVIPLLRQRWPGMSKTVSRSARHCAMADQVLDELLQRELRPLLHADGSLSLSGLQSQPSTHIPHLLRSWIRTAGLSLPGSATLERVMQELLPAAADRNPLVAWPGAELRRFRDRLYLISPLPPFDPQQSLEWLGEPRLTLPQGMGALHFKWTADAPPRERPEAGRYRVRFRRPGESCRPAGRGVTKRVKQLLQEAGVLPWMRDRVPLLEIDGEIGAIAGVCRCQIAEADRLFHSIRLEWQPPIPWRESA